MVQKLSKKSETVLYFDNLNTSCKDITCSPTRGSILGPLVFLIYKNDLKKASHILDPIMFTDDSNLSYSHFNIHPTFLHLI